MKKKRTKRTYGTGSLRQVGDETWELSYRPQKTGKRLSKRVKVPNQKAAEDALTAWRQGLDRQRNPGVKVRMKALFELHLADMRREQRNGYSIITQRNRIRKNLEPAFSSREAASIRKADITSYIDERLSAGAKPATINRELSALRRSFNLGLSEGLLIDPPPTIKCLKENNVRKGFVEHEIYSRMIKALPCHQQMLFAFGYYLGIRIGELLEFRWEWLLPYWQEEEPIIKVPGEFCKSGDPHTIPLYHPDLRAFVEMALAERDPKCPYLFQYRGEQLKNIRTGWKAACIAAGVPTLLFHDTRRTAIRIMEKAGTPRAEAMQITGHKTESIYKRYDIASERGAIKAGRQLRDYWHREGERATEANLQKNLGGELAVETPKPSTRAKAGKPLTN